MLKYQMKLTVTPTGTLTTRLSLWKPKTESGCNMIESDSYEEGRYPDGWYKPASWADEMATQMEAKAKADAKMVKAHAENEAILLEMLPKLQTHKKKPNKKQKKPKLTSSLSEALDEAALRKKEKESCELAQKYKADIKAKAKAAKNSCLLWV